MISIAKIPALFPVRRRKDRKRSSFRARGKLVGMKFVLSKTLLKVVGFQIRISFTSLFIYFDSCILKERFKPDNYNPNFRGFMRRRSLAKRRLITAILSK